MIDVAIIGAGSAGLVAARHLISAGLRPVLFEVAKTIGGAWTPSSDEHHHPASKMWSGMRTNLSKYTCQFTDFPWPEGTQTFPSVEEMHHYLQSYSDTFLDHTSSSSSSCEFLMECQVTNVEQLHNSDMAGAAPLNLDDRKANYKVEWLDLNTQKANCRDFGGVVIASGFFHTPCMPAFLQQYINMNNNEYAPGCSRRLQMIHSSQYRSHNEFKDKNVAVIGGSFSSLEIATDVSKSAARVVNVLPTIPWVLPRWIYKFHPFLSSESVVSGNNAKTITILPTDLALYQRTQPFRYQGEFKELTPEACQERHQYVQSLIGEKQRNSQLGEPTNWDEPTIVTISDEYVDLVNEEKIHVLQGRLVGIDDDGRLQINDTTGDTNHAPLTLLDDIDHVICATGYKPNLHNFLSSQILSTLDYDQEDKFSPMTLAYDTLHPSLPNLAFCGLYKGPYMGVLDLQARLAAKLMSGSLSIDDETYKIATKTSERMRKSSPRAQFPHFYPDLMDTLAQLLNSDKCEGELGIVVPPLYSADGCVRETCRLDLEREIKRGQDGSRMPRLVLGSILGSWGYDRSIVHLKTGKNEHVSGTVKYSKYWTRDSGDDINPSLGHADNNPVLYREDGVYEYSPTQKFDVFREYEYEVKHDALEVYFVEGGKRAHMFLSLKFTPEAVAIDDTTTKTGYWVKATSDHLCIKDLYSATFRVKLIGLSASEIIIKYRVKGPSKDYESTTILKPKKL